MLITKAYNFNVNTAPGTVTGVRTVYSHCMPSMGTCLLVPLVKDLFTSFVGDLMVAFFVGVLWLKKRQGYFKGGWEGERLGDVVAV